MKIETIKKKGFAISLIAFPVMLLVGFLMHPNLLKLEALQTVEQLVGRFHNQTIFHIGHLIVMFAVPVIKNTSWQNEMFFNCLPDIRYKKNKDFKCVQPCV
jgi:hypothetical protein